MQIRFLNIKTYSLSTLHFMQVKFLNIKIYLLFTFTLHAGQILQHKNLIILVVNIYCASMLCYNNVCSQFTDIISCEGAAGVIPVLTRFHGHAVFASAFSPLTRRPVFIVQSCPIAPNPGALYTTVYHHTHSTQFKHVNWPQSIRSKKA